MKYLNFSYDSNKTFANIFFMFFTSKIFFCCKSNKRKVRSKWELILRPLFLIVSNVTSYNFIPIISSCFLRQKFHLFIKKKKGTRSKWKDGLKYMTYVKYLHFCIWNKKNFYFSLQKYWKKVTKWCIWNDYKWSSQNQLLSGSCFPHF